MELHISRIKSKEPHKYILLDNDVLSALYYSEELFIKFINFCDEMQVRRLIDEFVRFEFLRGLYIPEDRLLKEAFISEIGAQTSMHSDIYKKIYTVALNLSRIYAHNNCQSPSIVDLMIAARSYLYSGTLIATINGKDYPQVVFNTQATATFRKEDDTFVTISILNFSIKKYNECIESLKKVKYKKPSKV